MNVKPRMAGIIQNQGVFAVSMRFEPDQSQIPVEIMDELGRQEISLEIITYSRAPDGGGMLLFAVRNEKLATTLTIVRKYLTDDLFRVFHQLSVISVFGPEFRDKPGVVGPVTSALHEVDIRILAMSTSISTVSCLIEAAKIQEAERVIRKIFED